MLDAPEHGPEAANIRFLRRMTTVLTAVMILGLLTMIALFVIRFWGPATPGPVAQGNLADPAGLAAHLSLDLPQGETARAVTVFDTWRIVVTASGQILVYDTAGKLVDRHALPSDKTPGTAAPAD